MPSSAFLEVILSDIDRDTIPQPEHIYPTPFPTSDGVMLLLAVWQANSGSELDVTSVIDCKFGISSRLNFVSERLRDDFMRFANAYIVRFDTDPNTSIVPIMREGKHYSGILLADTVPYSSLDLMLHFQQRKLRTSDLSKLIIEWSWIVENTSGCVTRQIGGWLFEFPEEAAAFKLFDPSSNATPKNDGVKHTYNGSKLAEDYDDWVDSSVGCDSPKVDPEREDTFVRIAKKLVNKKTFTAN